MLSVFTDTPGVTAPIQANILPPTFQASCPPPHGSDTLAPGKLRQMALTSSRLMASPLTYSSLVAGPTPILLRQLGGRNASHATSVIAEAGRKAFGPSGYPLGLRANAPTSAPKEANAWWASSSASKRAANVAGSPRGS